MLHYRQRTANQGRPEPQRMYVTYRCVPPSPPRLSDSEPGHSSDSPSPEGAGPSTPKKRRASSSNMDRNYQDLLFYVEDRLRKYIADANHQTVPIHPVVDRDAPYITLPQKKLGMMSIIDALEIGLPTYKSWIRLPE